MTTSEVQLLSAKLDKIDERLWRLEQEIAERRGADEARSMSRGQLIGAVMVISAVVGTASAIASQILSAL
jgi:hypothetical protein